MNTEQPSSPKGFRSLKRLALDASPLRESRDFRLLWIGNTISSIGSSIALIAMPYQVYAITHSTSLVGALYAAELLPLLACSLFGGSIADASDRRKLMRAILFSQAISSAILGFYTLGHVHLWVLFPMAAVQAGLWGLVIPARRSWSPRLVRQDQIAASAALESATMTFAHLAGPAIGGVLLATIGLSWIYGLDAFSFGFAIAAVQLTRPSPPSEHAASAGLRSVFEGLRFLKGKPLLQGSFLSDLNAMVFGMPLALFPAVALSLPEGKKILGLLYAAPFLGAFIGTTLSGWTGRVRRQGLGVTISVVCWGLAIAAFGYAHNAWMAIATLAAAGFADNASAIFRTAIVREVTPDHLRGRLSGMEIAVYAGGPTLGNVEAGVVAGLTSVQFSIVSGGLACLAGAAIISAALPAFNRYDRLRSLEGR